MLIGYVRSVHLLQAPYSQVTRLIAIGCQAVFLELSSGDHLDRPVLHRAIDGLRAGDVLVVGDADRLSRSDLQTDILLRRIHECGAELRLLGPDDDLLAVHARDSS